MIGGFKLGSFYVKNLTKQGDKFLKVDGVCVFLLKKYVVDRCPQ